MEYEDQEEQEGDIRLCYDDSLPISAAPPLPPPPRPKSRYKECLKNHAVSIGGHATDGCGEFIAAGDDGTLDSLKCAACGCHRNFHRKDAAAGGGGAFFPFSHHHHYHHHHGNFGYRHVAAAGQRPALLALPSSSGGGGAMEDVEEYNYYSNPSSGAQKKRFRTKFSQEQKEKMVNLAERLGWKIQKQDEELVQSFCNEMGIKRHVLKVWMHNNKHTLGKKT